MAFVRKIRPQTFFAVLLTLLGLAQTLGEYGGSEALYGLGRISAASPLPRPFIPHRGLEFWRNRIRVSWQTRSGVSGSAPLDRAVYKRIGGPHVVAVAYSFPFTAAPRLSQRIWRPPLEHGFCRGGILARAFEIEEPLARVEVEIQNPGLRDGRWGSEVTCP